MIPANEMERNPYRNVPRNYSENGKQFNKVNKLLNLLKVKSGKRKKENTVVQ